MAGRPQLRIGTHGKIKRIYQGGGIWLARCRYRDTDGATRVVQKLRPADEYDKYGKLAEDALVAVLAERKERESTARSDRTRRSPNSSSSTSRVSPKTAVRP